MCHYLLKLADIRINFLRLKENNNKETMSTTTIAKTETGGSCDNHTSVGCRVGEEQKTSCSTTVICQNCVIMLIFF